MIAAPDIPGAREVVEWFGYWPSFHDAEVLSIRLHRSDVSIIELHTFHRTSDTDERGHYICTRHAVLTFSFSGFLEEPEMRIAFFNHQNVLFGAIISAVEGGHAIELDGTFGVIATIACKELRVSLRPGVPAGSMYRENGTGVSI